MLYIMYICLLVCMCDCKYGGGDALDLHIPMTRDIRFFPLKITCTCITLSCKNHFISKHRACIFKKSY